MPDRTPTPEKLVQFLLGELSGEETATIEELVFAEEEPYALLRSAEDDLVDAYVAGELPPGRVHRFEARFLANDGGRRRVELARALGKKRASAPAAAPAPASPGLLDRLRAWTTPRLLGRALVPLAAAALLLVVLVPRGPMELTLEPALRSGSVTAEVPRRELELHLRVDVALTSWWVVVEREGTVVHESRGTGAVDVRVPKAALAPGLHEVRLGDGAGAVIEYYRFRVVD